MNDSKISVRYAHALFQSSLEKKILEKVYRDMIYILEISNVPEFKEMLESPIIVPSKKASVIHNTIGRNLEEITNSLIDLVVRNGRETFLPGIAREFIRSTKEYKGITESVVTTAVQIDAKIIKQISDLIEKAFKTKAELKQVVDKDIIGGFILKIEDNYIDASVRNKLRKIERELKSRTLTI